MITVHSVCHKMDALVGAQLLGCTQLGFKGNE